MKCLILAAGYATRLYPITENFPKPLLEVKGKTILDWLVDDIDTSGMINEYVVISNHKFVDHFKKWADEKTQKITIVDDGTTSNETRLGAVKDIQFAIDEVLIDEDILVIAGDNLLDFSLTKFIKYANEKKASCVMRCFEGSVEKLRKTGVLKIDDNDMILEMVEKPENPASNWCCPPFYYYVKEDVPMIAEGIKNGCGVDAPGGFVQWLNSRRKVFAMEMPGKRYDIGDIASYEKVKKEYCGI